MLRGQESTPVSSVHGRQAPWFGVRVAFECLGAAEQGSVLYWCEGHLPVGLITHSLLQDLSQLVVQHSAVVRHAVLDAAACRVDPVAHSPHRVLALHRDRAADVQAQALRGTGEAHTEKNWCGIPSTFPKMIFQFSNTKSAIEVVDMIAGTSPFSMVLTRSAIMWLSQIDLLSSKQAPNANNRLLVNLTQISGDLKKKLDWTGLDWTGLDWTGLDWTGLDWT